MNVSMFSATGTVLSDGVDGDGEPPAVEGLGDGGAGDEPQPIPVAMPAPRKTALANVRAVCPVISPLGLPRLQHSYTNRLTSSSQHRPPVHGDTIYRHVT
jgi:hypothetical protein